MTCVQAEAVFSTDLQDLAIYYNQPKFIFLVSSWLLLRRTLVYKKKMGLVTVP